MSSVVVVDGFSTGQFLAPALAERGVTCAHVQSSHSIPSVFDGSYFPEHYAAHHVWPEDEPGRARLLEHLAGGDVRAVIVGCETGVLVADELSERLGLAGNGRRLSLARRDKDVMQTTLAKAGLAHIPHERFGDVRALLQWFEGLSRPIVLKPPCSAGAEDVLFCSDANECRRAFDVIIGKVNAFGLRNEFVVAQQQMMGAEYIVNTVSCEGVHCVTDVWRCRKISAGYHGMLSALEELIPLDDAESERVTAYALRTLDAFGIRVGPAHQELILDSGTPYLVEIGARLQGAVVPDALQQALGATSIEKTVRAFLEPDKFLATAGRYREVDKRIFRIFMLNHRAGKLAALSGLPIVESLPSFHSMKFYARIGQHLPQTTDYFSSPGLIHLVHASHRQLEDDYKAIRRLEDDGMYELEV